MFDLDADLERIGHAGAREVRDAADAEQWVMQVRLGDEWQSLYTFDRHPQHQPDYEVTNWYLSTNPRSSFTYMLMAARPADDRRYALRDNVLTVRHLDGRVDERALGTRGELRAVLERDFAVAVPQGPDVDALLDRLTAPRVSS